MKQHSISYLFDDSQIETNESKVIDYINIVVCQSISKLSSPCTKLSFRPYFIQLVKISKCDDTKVKTFPKEFWKGMPELQRRTWMNPVRMFEVALLIYFSKRRESFSIVMTYTLLDIYSSLYHTFFRYCNPELFEFSLTLLSKNHLFAREGGIGTSLTFLSSELTRKYYESFVQENKNNISKFISEARTRIAQSLKSFAYTYYKSSKKYSSDIDTQIDNSKFKSGGDLVAYQVNIIAKINARALRTTELMVGKLPTLAIQLLKTISIIVYKDDVSTAIRVFLESNSNLSTSSFCNNKKFLEIYTNTMRVKKASHGLHYKSEIQKLIQKTNVKLPESKTKQYQILFAVGLYLINILRVSLCKNI